MLLEYFGPPVAFLSSHVSFRRLLVLLWVLTILYCEGLAFYLQARQCPWPESESKTTDRPSTHSSPEHLNAAAPAPPPYTLSYNAVEPGQRTGTTDHGSARFLRVLAFSDSHMLGLRNKSWLTRTWVNWQLRKALWGITAGLTSKADLIVFLGDQIDEGSARTSSDKWQMYVQQWRSLTRSIGTPLDDVPAHSIESEVSRGGYKLEMWGTADEAPRKVIGIRELSQMLSQRIKEVHRGDEGSSLVIVDESEPKLDGRALDIQEGSAELGEGKHTEDLWLKSITPAFPSVSPPQGVESTVDGEQQQQQQQHQQRQQHREIRRPPILHIIGNHDAQFGRFLERELVERFEWAFGSTNRLVWVDGVTFVTVNSMALAQGVRDRRLKEDTIRFLEAVSSLRSQVVDVLNTGIDLGFPASNLFAQTVLLSHFPLYRESDIDCGPERLREQGHITYEHPSFRYSADHHVLSKYASEMLLRSVKPSLVLSGHTHAVCRYTHKGEVETAGETLSAPNLPRKLKTSSSYPVENRRRELDKRNVRVDVAHEGRKDLAQPPGTELETLRATPELTIPTFSWGQRPDPSYALLRIPIEWDNDRPSEVAQLQLSDIAIVCRVLDERTVFALYGVLLLLTVFGEVWLKIAEQMPTRSMLSPRGGLGGRPRTKDE